MTEPIRPTAIARVLPHRYPFQLIDLVLSDPHEMAQGRVRALKNISANDSLLQGGTLTAGRFPSVLLLEALAQAAGMLVHHRLTLLEAGQPCYFAAIRRAHFYAAARAGDRLHLDVRLLRQRRNMVRFSGVATVAGKRLCVAEFTCAS
ncbi:beta-hydroxyacyl-ACP dehydratase [Serratia rubidaea]|uniref:(3R)-hydroxymyristoyl-[acyl-carrier-protein] dehydratase n=2 Tax=Serratia rubidaea TaxID=61652 RepID=A0A3S4X4J4_SERRU|nr:beta-hydroxyacyl-ACP dehydratase [Serratia rubidaea]MBH1930354.1 beta-hydroxyacyl-ACP dehydratase [Serratia rubidaea]MDC6117452.1 beta-hydroxyacyl-ACP dehydratase [Serratia rubidaea]MEB7586473.1 beta-hydroxyacyl-ACP dehydratase [Serratia rubidaea]VEI65381.1 (3R)-hydroxymyristoyl-[acyl-carrier-protein] dehydratase [Serratia rubidaea]